MTSPRSTGCSSASMKTNAAGGFTGKMKIELVSRDMRSETAESAVIAQELIGQGVNFLIVPCDVDPAVAAGQIAAAAGIPAMSSCASTPTLPGIVGEYMFSNYTADNLQAAALGDYAIKQGYKNAFVLLSKDTPYTQKLPEYFARGLPEEGRRHRRHHRIQDGPAGFRRRGHQDQGAVAGARRHHDVRL